MSNKFKVGDRVEWTSQAGGFSKRKCGYIAFVIPAGKLPREISPGLKCDIGTTLGRRTESYVVKVGSKHYWPAVTRLQADGNECRIGRLSGTLAVHWNSDGSDSIDLTGWIAHVVFQDGKLVRIDEVHKPYLTDDEVIEQDQVEQPQLFGSAK